MRTVILISLSLSKSLMGRLSILFARFDRNAAPVKP
jgi:hypothetical protein